MPDELTYQQKLDLAGRTGLAHDYTDDVVYGAIVSSRGNWVESGNVTFSQQEADSFAYTISNAVTRERNLTDMFEEVSDGIGWLARQGMNIARALTGGRDVTSAASVGALAGGAATVGIGGVGSIGGAAFGASMLAANAAAENSAAERFLRELEERGINPGDRTQLARALQDPAIMGSIMTEVNTSQGISMGTTLAASAIPGNVILNTTLAGGVDGGTQAVLEGRNVAQVTAATLQGASEGAAVAIPGGRGVSATMDVALRL